MTRIDIKAFNFDLKETCARLEEFIEKEKNFIFVAKDKDENCQIYNHLTKGLLYTLEVSFWNNR